MGGRGQSAAELQGARVSERKSFLWGERMKDFKAEKDRRGTGNAALLTMGNRKIAHLGDVQRGKGGVQLTGRISNRKAKPAF